MTSASAFSGRRGGTGVGQPVDIMHKASDARRELIYELASSGCGVALALFMAGHMLLVGSILAGARGFDQVAIGLENFNVAQPTVVVVLILFTVHAVLALRKVPAGLRQRRRLRQLAQDLRPATLAPSAGGRDDPRTHVHLDSLLWIWQVRTGFVILVLGSFHVLLLGVDVLTPLFGERTGIEAASSAARVAGGLWPIYAVLLLCVEFHAGAGLYRLAVKWGTASRVPRSRLRRIEFVIIVVFLGIGSLALAVLAGWLEPPLEFLVAGSHG
jgi:fumarate reductase subunit C